MINIENRFMSIPSKGVVSHLVFGRAALDFIKADKSWMYWSDKGLQLVSARNAARLARAMRNSYQELS